MAAAARPRGDGAGRSGKAAGSGPVGFIPARPPGSSPDHSGSPARRSLRAHAGPALGLLLLALLLASAASLFLPLDPQAGPRQFRVEPGLSFGAIEARLVEGHFLAVRGPLRLWARLTGRDRQIRPGTYELSAAQSPRDLLRTLASGRVVLRRVTIPEGFALAAILARISEEMGLPLEETRAEASDSAWVRSLALPGPGLEGYLFPETYLFDPVVGVQAVLTEMTKTMLARFDEPRRARAAELGMSLHDVLTLASIIELEAAVPEERERIAAVYHNRLRQGLLLQADPTAAYAAGVPGQRLSQRDLALDSPFNTYVHPGLPPGPICSPGLASIDAALWPLIGCGDLYFVARGDGTHVFSRTLEQHNRARAELDRAR